MSLSGPPPASFSLAGRSFSPEAEKQAVSRTSKRRRVVVVVILCFSFLNLGNWIRTAGRPCVEGQPEELQPLNCIFAAILVFQTSLAVMLVWFAGSAYLLRVAGFVLIVWLNVSFALLRGEARCRGVEWPSGLLSIAQLASGAIIIVVFVYFACARLHVLESAMLQPLGSRSIRWLFRTVLADAVVFALALALKARLPSGVGAAVLSANFWLALAVVLALLLQVLSALRRVIGLLAAARKLVGSPAPPSDPSAVAAELRRSRVTVVLLFVGVLHCSVTLLLNTAAAGIHEGMLWPGSKEDVPMAWALMNAFFCIDRFITGASCCVFSGVFTGSLPASREVLSTERWRQAKRARAVKAYRPCPDASWQQKVEELADRGFSLRALLDFYKRLGTPEVMPHYSGERSTTLDVVRQAIIPLSREGQSSLASVMMDGRPVRPDKMVTHNWGNLFRDLVACIVAEALGEDEYYMTAYWLDNDISLVEEWLSAAAVMDATYWVCAFSINQHAGICGGNPCGETDSVTGELHPVCDCGLGKCFNNTAPLGYKGQSIRCEMNKFDNMLEFLGAQNPDFKHVIAVDRKFTLFSRAWCIAEIAKAFEFGIVQHLVLPSAVLLRENEGSLHGLKVEDMKATRQEDVEAILAKIPDKAEFNRQLQHLIHDKLLVSWGALDEGQKLQRAGRMARWQLACQRRSAGAAPWQAALGAAGAAPPGAAGTASKVALGTSGAPPPGAVGATSKAAPGASEVAQPGSAGNVSRAALDAQGAPQQGAAAGKRPCKVSL